MKSDKKQKFRGMKHKVSEEKTRGRSIGLAFTAAILIVILCISGFLINSMLNQPSVEERFSFTSKTRAAIVDHLSLTRPNQTFIEAATNILKQAGYTVDYYAGEEVTINFYGSLPTYGYGLIIFRVHSSARQMQGEEIVESDLSLFTSELYSSSKYIQQQLDGRVVSVKFLHGDETLYFGIRPRFIMSNANFHNTIIIMMGCDGLMTTSMAKAFTEKGAKAYIGWDDSILGTRNDPAITRLLQHLITEKQTIKNATANTMTEFPPSPTDYSVLRYYPLKAGKQIIENIKNDG
jgi:hypothetical protein